VEKGSEASNALIEYFKGIIKSRRGDPGDDLIGQLIRAEEAGDSLSERELYNTCLLLLVAGHETTTRLIGNGAYLLLKHGLWGALRADPERIPTAIEEMLRFEPPVQATQRFVLEDLDFHGKRMKRGDSIFVSIAGGNRDPGANDAPDRFDIGREKVSQVSFGYGIHLALVPHSRGSRRRSPLRNCWASFRTCSCATHNLIGDRIRSFADTRSCSSANRRAQSDRPPNPSRGARCSGRKSRYSLWRSCVSQP
jgi:hypothetical protein